MNQACVRNDTIDAGNHHGRPQYRSFLRFLTSQERNVIWLLLAIAFLPVDGTTLGLYAPFWSPISPALFAVYCLCNWRQLRIAANRYLPMFLLPVACIILSIPGWLKFGIHLNAAFMSITGLLGVLATLGAIALAFDIKRIPWRTPLRILIASYWVSFGVGVVQWLSIRLHAKPLTDYFSHLMYRQYISDNSVWGGGRPQFLFAEPSYIGMHLFGILLPLMWLMRGRDRIYAKRLRDLIVTYAVGAVLMQAGTRIVIDSVVALLIALWRAPIGMTAHAASGACCRFSAHAHWACWVCWRIPDSPPSRKTGPRETARSSRGSTKASIRYADCSPIRGRCSPVMARATSSMRCGSARPKPDGCWTVLA